MVDYQTIKIDYSGNKEVLSVDLIDSIEYIILEEPSLLVGQVEKMVVENGKILLCANSNKCIWVFDDKGKFVNQLSRLGQGPAQYTSLNGFSFTPPDKVHINDGRAQKIKTYALSGELIAEEKTEGYVSNYVESEGFKYLFNHDFASTGKGEFYFNVKSSTGTSKGFLAYTHPFRFSGNGGDFILKTNESLYLTLPYYDTIYSYENQQLVPKYVLDFGTNKYPTQELYNTQTMDEIHHILGKGGYIGNPSHVLISNQHLVFKYGQQIDAYNSNVSTLVYNFITNTLCTYSIFDQGQHEIAVGYPMATDGASFYSLKHLYEIPDSIKASLDGPNLAPDQDSNPIIINLSSI